MKEKEKCVILYFPPSFHFSHIVNPDPCSLRLFVIKANPETIALCYAVDGVAHKLL